MFQKICLGSIQFYQRVLSPFLPQSCRYHPSCSEYAHQAIHEYGVRSGGFLALKRLCRCHPWGGSGLDPVKPRWASDRKRLPTRSVGERSSLKSADRRSRLLPIDGHDERRR